jgi:hypothetical protein
VAVVGVGAATVEAALPPQPATMTAVIRAKTVNAAMDVR